MSKEKPLILYGKELVMDAEAHAYTWGGTFVPGVTSILQVIAKQALLPWAVGLTRDYWLEQIKSGRKDLMAIHKESWSAHKKVSKTAANIGHNVHDYAECFFKNQKLPKLETDQAKRGVEAFHKWFDSHKIKIISSERMVMSQEFFYAGTCDFVAEIDGVLVVGDIKTSSGIYPEMRFQTAAYQQALQEEEGTKFAERVIVRFDKKTGEFEVKSFTDFELDFAGFRAALNLHRALQQMTG